MKSIWTSEETHRHLTYGMILSINNCQIEANKLWEEYMEEM